MISFDGSVSSSACHTPTSYLTSIVPNNPGIHDRRNNTGKTPLPITRKSARNKQTFEGVYTRVQQHVFNSRGKCRPCTVCHLLRAYTILARTSSSMPITLSHRHVGPYESDARDRLPISISQGPRMRGSRRAQQ